MSFTLKRQILKQLRSYFNTKELNDNILKIFVPNGKNKPKNDMTTKPTFYIESNNEINFTNNDHTYDLIRKSCPFVTRIYTQLNDQNKHQLMLEIDETVFLKQLINDLKFGITSYEKYATNDNKRKTIIIEFSSPNIAKPFHVGNFRSTIIGNFVANINSFFGNNVIRVNYLGDWGTQFGILSLAYDYFGDEKQLLANPLKHLFDVYVNGNKECDKSDEWREEAKQRFYAIESAQNVDALKQWQQFRQLSINELKALYSRVGIEFDEFHSESMYSKASIELVNKYKQTQYFEQTEDNAVYANIQINDNFEKVPVMKKDGTTLYLTRDISAAIHRKQMYNFDKMYYVVDSTQSKHFNHLKNILKTIGNDFHDDLIHLKFGRILGMSTRKGEIIFLDDVLNEAKERAIESMKSSPTTKVEAIDFDDIADTLGISGIFIHDMCHRRVSDYKFDWNKALQHVGNTGISLQYTHARLCNLEINCGVDLDLDFDIDTNAIDCVEAKQLALYLAQFDDAFNDAFAHLEPNILVKYLFHLKSAINRANKVLTVKGEHVITAKSRLLLFYCSKIVLNQSLKLLGLKPLNSF